MPKLIVTDRHGAERPLEARAGLSIMEIIRDSGFGDLASLCGGCCSCATCHIYVEDGALERLPALGADEDALLDGCESRRASSRLACQLRFDAGLDGLRVAIAAEG